MDEIEIVTDSLGYWSFYERFIAANKPCILSAKFTDLWSCRSDWVKNDKPNMDYFREKYANLRAPVVNCHKQFYSSHEKCEMTILEYCDYWNERGDKLLYLKDWHLQMNEINKPFYEVPMYFTSDWLNEYWDKLKENDDYRFVYIGVKDTWTPFHADVFRSFSWSANICGLKKWLLYPPGEEEFLKDKFNKLPFDVTDNIDQDMYPNWSKAREPIIVYQKAGEIIFVPSGWHHQVYNMEDTISVNHNWVNASCIDKMLKQLCDELITVKKEIQDCKSMDGFHLQCQLILKASSGIDFAGFYEMISYLIESRLEFIDNIGDHGTVTFGDELLLLLSSFYITSIPGCRYSFKNITVEEEIKFVHYDLQKLKIVCRHLIEHDDFEITNSHELVIKGSRLIEKIDDILDNR